MSHQEVFEGRTCIARAQRRKGSLHRLCGERVLLRVIDTLRLIGFGQPTRPLFSTPDEVFAGNHIFLQAEYLRESVQVIRTEASGQLTPWQVLVAFCVCTVVAFERLALLTALMAPQRPWHARSFCCREAALPH